MEITQQYKDKVLAALKLKSEISDVTNAMLARRLNLNTTTLSRLLSGQSDKILEASKWIALGRELEVSMNQRQWRTAKTEVFVIIEEQVKFCQQHSKSMVFVDQCEIGKTYTAKYLSKALPHCFYLDVSQCKTRQLFVRAFARVLGVDFKGTYNDVKENIKYYLSIIDKPIIILDEFGDANNSVFLEVKEFWNATEGICGWYMMGAEGLRYKIERSINKKVVGFAEILSRFSSRISSVVPVERAEKTAFYKKLITDVISANTADQASIKAIVQKCLIQNDSQFGGLRRAESLLILNQQ